MATQNSYPKPFLRDNCSQPVIILPTSSQYHQNVNPNGAPMCANQVPKIMVDNQQYNNQYQHTGANTSRIEPAPTSTVHKSMYKSRQVVGVTEPQSNSSAPYSRLISPTISQGSVSPQSGQTEFVQYRNHDQRRKPVQQIHNMCGRSTLTSGALKEALYSPTDQQQQYQLHHIQQNQQPSPTMQQSYNRGADGEGAAGKGGQDYKQLLARISPSSPRHLASNVLLPDDKRDGYMHDKQIEQLSIAHQTYRTTPIVLPKPKARHDLATGSYMHLNQDPTWDMLERASSASSLNLSDQAIKFQQAMKGTYQHTTSGTTKEQDVILNSLPRSTMHNTNNNNVTGFIGARAAKLANVQPIYRSQTGECVSGSGTGVNSSQRDSSQDSTPIFDYRQYIESTRHAR